MSQDHVQPRRRARAIAVAAPAQDPRNRLVTKAILAAAAVGAAVQAGWLIHIAMG